MSRRLATGAFAILALLGTAMAPAQAQQMPAPVIGVLDFQAIIRDSTAAIGIRAEIEKHHIAFQNEITERENTLRAADQELAQQRAILSPEVVSERERGLQQSAAALSQLVEVRKRQVTLAFGNAMQQVEEAVVGVVSEIMQERGLNMVLPRSQVVVVAPELMLTDEVLKRLNDRLKSVSVVIPEG